MTDNHMYRSSARPVRATSMSRSRPPLTGPADWVSVSDGKTSRTERTGPRSHPGPLLQNTMFIASENHDSSVMDFKSLEPETRPRPVFPDLGLASEFPSDPPAEPALPPSPMVTTSNRTIPPVTFGIPSLNHPYRKTLNVHHNVTLVESSSDSNHPWSVLCKKLAVYFVIRQLHGHIPKRDNKIYIADIGSSIVYHMCLGPVVWYSLNPVTVPGDGHRSLTRSSTASSLPYNPTPAYHAALYVDVYPPSKRDIAKHFSTMCNVVYFIARIHRGEHYADIEQVGFCRDNVWYCTENVDNHTLAFAWQHPSLEWLLHGFEYGGRKYETNILRTVGMFHVLSVTRGTPRRLVLNPPPLAVWHFPWKWTSPTTWIANRKVYYHVETANALIGAYAFRQQSGFVFDAIANAVETKFSQTPELCNLRRVMPDAYQLYVTGTVFYVLYAQREQTARQMELGVTSFMRADDTVASLRSRHSQLRKYEDRHVGLSWCKWIMAVGMFVAIVFSSTWLWTLRHTSQLAAGSTHARIWPKRPVLSFLSETVLLASGPLYLVVPLYEFFCSRLSVASAAIHVFSYVFVWLSRDLEPELYWPALVSMVGLHYIYNHEVSRLIERQREIDCLDLDIAILAAKREQSTFEAPPPPPIPSSSLFSAAMRWLPFELMARIDSYNTHCPEYDHFRACRLHAEQYECPSMGMVEYLPLNEGVPATVSQHSLNVPIEGSLKLTEGKRPTDLATVEKLLPRSTPHDPLHSIYPVLITSGLLHLPARCERNIFVALVHRQLKPTALEEYEEESWRPGWQTIQEHFHHMPLEITAEEYMAGSAKRALYEAAVEEVRRSGNHLNVRRVMLKSNETLGFGKKPRAINALSVFSTPFCAAVVETMARYCKRVMDGNSPQPKRNGDLGSYILYYASSRQMSHVSETVWRNTQASDLNQTFIAAAGDDLLVWQGNHGYEADATAFDQSQQPGALLGMAALLRRLAIPEEILDFFIHHCRSPMMIQTKRFKGVARSLSTQLPTGIMFTTLSNTLVMLAAATVIFADKSAPIASCEATARRLGLTLKIKRSTDVTDLTFLKSWFPGPCECYPLPSLIVKLGKLLEPPTVVARKSGLRNLTSQQAIDVFAYAFSTALPDIAPDYPLLSTYISTLARLGVSKRYVPDLQFREGYNDIYVTRGNQPRPDTRDRVLLMMERRYRISRVSVEEVERLLSSVTRLPAFVVHPLFDRLIAVDYG